MARILTFNEFYCEVCHSAPCLCRHSKNQCPKCGREEGCKCWFTEEELEHYRTVQHAGTSRIFPAAYSGPCKRCGARMNRGVSAQFIDDLYGHPLGKCTLPLEKEIPTMSEIKNVITATERRLGELYAERDAQESWGKDADYPNETVLWFKQAYNGSHQYDYTAAKIRPNTWYLTGKWSVAMGFDQLVRDHLMKADEVWIVTAWEKVSK